MRGLRTLGLCVVAVAVALALAASSASAALPAPHWASCVKLKKNAMTKKYEGKYKNKTCSEPEPKGEGKYELEQSVGKGKVFKGSTPKVKVKKGEEVPNLVVMHFKNPITSNAVSLECASGTDEGKPETANIIKELSFTYTSCKMLGKVCRTSGAKEGELKFSGLKGVLGYVEEEPEVVVGLKVKNETEEPEPTENGFPGVIGEFSCGEPGEVTATVTGQVIGIQSGDVNTFSKEFTVLDNAKLGCWPSACTAPPALEPEFECPSLKPGQCGYGQHEFDSKQYRPLVNIIGWGEEDEQIEKCEAENENCEEHHPAHVLKTNACGKYIKSLINAECIEGIYSGLDQSMTNKGENLMVKT